VCFTDNTSGVIIGFYKAATVAANNEYGLFLGSSASNAGVDVAGGAVKGGKVNSTNGDGTGYLKFDTTSSGGGFTNRGGIIDGAWTLGAANVQTTHTIHGVVNVNAATNALDAYIQFQHVGVAKGYIGSNGTTGTSLITGLTEDFAVAIVGVDSIGFSGNTGTTLHGKCSQAGAWTLGPADGSGGVQFPNSGLSGYTASTLNVYEAATGSFSVAPSAGSGSATVSYAATRIGNIVTLTVEAFNITLSGAVGYLIGSTALPSRFRPGNPVQFPIWTKENGADLSNPSLMYIYSSGRIDIYKTGVAGTTFANGVAGCTARASVSYTVS